ncbi:MAG: serine/threonine-protein kinase [Sciscionella sp.]
MVAGHYRVLDRIGSGAMGVVWRARDERLGRTVAIKQLFVQPGLSDTETETGRLRAMREARIAAMLQHPNAIAIFDIAEHEGDPCLVMEYVPAQGLDSLLIERGSLDPEEVAAIGAQVASALAAAHEKGIVHRDIKPGNVLIDSSGVAKISDFGISRAVGDATVTQTGVLSGTPAYLAPEVARGQNPSSASDVFSLGATLYTAVEGYPPFGHNQNPLAALHAAAAGKVLPPQQAGGLTALLMSLLRTDPSARPDMAEASTKLAAVAPNHDGARWAAATPAPAEPTMIGPVRLREPPEREPGPARHAGIPKKGVIAGLGGLAMAIVLLGLVLTGVNLGWFGGDQQSLTGGASSSAPRQQAQPPAGSPRNSGPSSTTSSSSEPSESSSSTKPSSGSSGEIPYSQAGQLVINYYNGFSNPSSAWGMLTSSGKAVYGSEQAFQQYWKKYSPVSAQNARGVTTNSDGSVNVPVDVTAGGQTTHKVVRVVNQNGTLLIDADTR